VSGGANAKAARRAGEVAKADADAAYDDIAMKLAGMRAGGMSLAEIAEYLNSQGHTTRRGHRWNKVQVGRVLKRAAT
jgi:hypothetical protein